MRGSRQRIISLGIIGLCWLGACRSKVETNERHINNITLSAWVLPAQEQAKSAHNKRTLAFLLSIQPQTKGTDLMRQGITRPEEYAQRVETLSFRAADYISFRIGETSLLPTLARYENTHDPSGKVDIILKLVMDEAKWNEVMDTTDQVELVLEDPYWKTGIHHFTFDKQQLASSI